MDKSAAGRRDTPRAILFDAYGTLFDVYSVGLLAEQLFPGQGQALAILWRDKQIEYTRLVTTSSHGAPPMRVSGRAAIAVSSRRNPTAPPPAETMTAGASAGLASSGGGGS